MNIFNFFFRKDFVDLYLTDLLIRVNATSFYHISDETAQRFSRYMRKYPELYDEIVEIILNFINKERAIILDLGMGPGFLLQRLAIKHLDTVMVGIDPSPAMTRIAYNDSHGIYFVLKGNSETLPFCNNSIQIVVSRFSLPYWSDPQKSFQEIYRVLKPNGLLVLDVLNKSFSKILLNLIRLRMYVQGTNRDLIRYHFDAFKSTYNYEEICNMLRKTNFSIASQDINLNDWHYILQAQKHDFSSKNI